MNYFKRLIYLIYYLKITDYSKLRKYNNYVSKKTGKFGIAIIVDALTSVFKYNISILDYYYFRFYAIDSKERLSWAGTGYMYEYQLKMNPKHSRNILENKLTFLNYYRQFVKRRYLSIDSFETNPDQALELLDNMSEKIVVKNSHGQVGAEVEVVSTKDLSTQQLIDLMKNKKYNLIEEYVTQHQLLNELSPTGLNTVRVFTQIENDKIRFLGARLRISVNSSVDNMGAGNLAAPVDIESGLVTGPAVYSDIEKDQESYHPLTGKEIDGFYVPHWTKVVELARDAAMLCPDNRSVGWDIAITDDGVELIEGNHNWCKLLWQLPVRQGLKDELEKFL